MRELTIGGRLINDEEPCYVVAELSGNHGGSFSVAQQLIREAAKAGATAVKLVKRDVATLYSQAVLDQPYENEVSFGPTYGAHRQALELSAEGYAACLLTASANQITLFATAYDEPSVEFLANLRVPAIKIHSGGLTDESLIRAAAAVERPVILSTGGGTLDDIDRAVGWLGECPHALLHCTACYPLASAEANLRVISTLRKRFPQTVIGWSSHHTGIGLSLVAYALGARILEHHFTLDRAGRGTDHSFSLEPKGLATLVDDLEKARQALGDGVKRWYVSERLPIMKMRRCLTPEGMRITR